MCIRDRAEYVRRIPGSRPADHRDLIGLEAGGQALFLRFAALGQRDVRRQGETHAAPAAGVQDVYKRQSSPRMRGP